MTTQSIDDQLELLRLKELFMSDIDIRSKMAMLICREEDPSYSEFCQLTHCTPNIAKMFAQLLVIKRTSSCNQAELLPDIIDFNDAPDFPNVWVEAQRKIHEYFPYMEDGEVPFVAHNARFDEGCLRAAFATFELALPNYEFRDTLAASRNYFGSSLQNHQLHTVAAACGYDLQNHHHALADAEACAWIAKAIV